MSVNNEEQPVIKENKVSDELKQRIVGLSVIGIISVMLCGFGIFGGENEDIKAVNDSSIDNSSVSSELLSSAESSDISSSEDSDMDSESADEISSPVEEPVVTEPQVSAPDNDSSEVSIQTTKKTQSETTTITTSKKPEVTTSKKEASTTTTSKKDAAGALSAVCSVQNSWQDGDKWCAQINISLNNGSSSDVSSWTLELTVPSSAVIESSWSGDFSKSGNKIIIKPAEYNSIIPSGGKISDIGVIIKADNEFTPSISVKK